MAAPTSCTITSPTQGQQFTLPEGQNTMVITVSGTTDRDTPVNLMGYGANSVTSNGSGVWTGLNTMALGTGTYPFIARAGGGEDFTNSDPVTITIVAAPDPNHPTQAEYLAAVTAPTDRTRAWYLNWLAQTLEGPVPGAAPLTEKDAACKWAGVSPNDYGLLGALNLKAGITDQGLWQPISVALNLLAYGVTHLSDAGPWLSDWEALYKVASGVVGPSE